MPGQQLSSVLDQVIIMVKGLVVAAYLKVERSKFSSSKGHSFRDYQDACNTKDDFMTTAQWTSQLTWTAVTDLKLSRAGGGWERMQHTSVFVNKLQLGLDKIHSRAPLLHSGVLMPTYLRAHIFQHEANHHGLLGQLQQGVQVQDNERGAR